MPKAVTCGCKVLLWERLERRSQSLRDDPGKRGSPGCSAPRGGLVLPVRSGSRSSLTFTRPYKIQIPSSLFFHEGTGHTQAAVPPLWRLPALRGSWLSHSLSPGRFDSLTMACGPVSPGLSAAPGPGPARPGGTCRLMRRVGEGTKAGEQQGTKSWQDGALRLTPGGYGNQATCCFPSNLGGNTQRGPGPHLG